MAEEVDTNRIANIIADIQQSQSNVEKAIKTRDELQSQLDEENVYIEEEQQSIQAHRQELEQYLDELIPGSRLDPIKYRDVWGD